MARAAKFQRFDKLRQEWVNSDPPQKVADILLVREGDWHVPPVVGITTTPILRRNGSLISQSGYDPLTRLFLVLDSNLQLPSIPESPTREDAQSALQVLGSLLTGFAFVTEVDEAVALSSLMTAVLRSDMTVVPLHAMRAYAAGTGKSHLVDLAAAISTGRHCPVITPGKSEEEMEKRLGALLRDGVSVVSLDNVNGELGGDLLCQLTERPIVRIRILGQSKAPEFECRASIFATGNNLVVVGDMTRRTLLCTLDAVIERPELRQFEFDPVERALSFRAEYLAAIFTIVRAYRVAGAPRVCDPLGSYGDWSNCVRSPLIWLGLPDPAASMEATRAEDPTLGGLRELFTHWREHFPIGAPFIATQLIEFARAVDENGHRRTPEFWELLLRLAGQGNDVSSRRLGRWLSKNKGRVVDGHRLVVQVDNHHGNRFSLVTSTE